MPLFNALLIIIYTILLPSVADARRIHLQWDPPAKNDYYYNNHCSITGYRLYYDDTTTIVTNNYDSPSSYIDVGKATEYIFDNIESEKWFGVTALYQCDDGETESNLSNLAYWKRRHHANIAISGGVVK